MQIQDSRDCSFPRREPIIWAGLSELESCPSSLLTWSAFSISFSSRLVLPNLCRISVLYCTKDFEVRLAGPAKQSFGSCPDVLQLSSFEMSQISADRFNARTSDDGEAWTG